MTRKRLEELLRRESPRVRRRYLGAIARVRDKYTLAKLESALEGGTISSVLDDLERAGALFAAQTEAVTALVANEVAEQLSKKLDVVVTYDGTNERAVAQLRANRARMVQGLREEARDAITDVLVEGTSQGLNPRQQAQGIRDSIGLTPKQAEWVRSYRRRLETLDRGALGMELRDARYDGTVDKAIKAGKPLTAKQVDKMVERYYQRALRYRAEVIARTEALRAVNAGSHEMYQQAVEDGTLDADLLVYTWHAGSAPRTRESHIAMRGQKRAHGQPFTSGNGYSLRYPGDPDAPASEVANCRCAVSTRVFLSKEEAQAHLNGTSVAKASPGERGLYYDIARAAGWY